jgi:hypothetical protein
MICPKCKSNIDNDSQFCPFCGYTVARQSGASSIITVGRNPGNDIIISDPGVSRNHARISLENGEYTIEDVGSANGTYVNGYKIHIQRLKSTDSIRLGNNAQLSFMEIDSAFAQRRGENHIPPAPYPNPKPNPAPRQDSVPQSYRNDDITVGQWIGNFILTAIPIIGLIILIVWISDSTKPSRSNWAKAMIIFNLLYLGFIVLIIVSVLGAGFLLIR